MDQDGGAAADEAGGKVGSVGISVESTVVIRFLSVDDPSCCRCRPMAIPTGIEEPGNHFQGM